MYEPDSSHDEEKIERLRRAMYSRTLSEKLKPRERRVLDLSRETVPEDFVQHEPDFSGAIRPPVGMSFTRKLLWWILGIAIVFFIGAIGFFIYYFMIGEGSLPASPDNITISVSGPPQVGGGNRTELQIVVQNRNRVPLENAELILTYPQGTRSSSVDQASEYSCSRPEGTKDSSLDLPQQRICLGTISSGGSRQGTVSAIFAGSEGEHESVKAELEYHLAGSNAVFVASSNYDLVFSSSPISISVDSNSETISGQPVQLTVNIASNASSPIKDVLLSADLPFGFKLKSATPAQGSNGLWQLGTLSAGEKRSITIIGTLNGSTGDKRVFHFTAGTRSAISQSKIDTVLAEIQQSMGISQPFLGLDVAINGESGASAVVQPGETVSVTVSYINNLSTVITNAIIVAKLTGVEIAGSTVHSTDGFFRSTDGSMMWDKSTTNGALSTLAPGAKGSVSFSFQMPSSSDLKASNKPRLAISVNAAGNRISETGVPESLQSSAVQNVSIASDLQFTAQGLYYASPFNSTGPLPPKAGVETTYALVFTVTNTSNKITKAVLHAHLPPYVRWLNKWAPQPESIKVKLADGSLEWDLGDIAPGVGLNGTEPRQVAVAIGFTPSTSQVGEAPSLLEDVVLSGYDDATGNKITLPVEDVTTDLTRVSKSSSGITAGVDPGFSPANATVVQ